MPSRPVDSRARRWPIVAAIGTLAAGVRAGSPAMMIEGSTITAFAAHLPAEHERASAILKRMVLSDDVRHRQERGMTRCAGAS